MKRGMKGKGKMLQEHRQGGATETRFYLLLFLIWPRKRESERQRQEGCTGHVNGSRSMPLSRHVHLAGRLSAAAFFLYLPPCFRPRQHLQLFHSPAPIPASRGTQAHNCHWNTSTNLSPSSASRLEAFSKKLCKRVHKPPHNLTKQKK